MEINKSQLMESSSTCLYCNQTSNIANVVDGDNIGYYDEQAATTNLQQVDRRLWESVGRLTRLIIDTKPYGGTKLQLNINKSHYNGTGASTTGEISLPEMHYSTGRFALSVAPTTGQAARESSWTQKWTKRGAGLNQNKLAMNK